MSNFAKKRERDADGRFVVPRSPSGFDAKEYRKKRYLDNKKAIIKQTFEWAKNNTEKRRLIRKRWKAKNREKVNHLNKLRIYREKSAEGRHTLQEVKAIKNAWNNKCAYCRMKPAETIDHVHPLTKGGSNNPNNLVPACFSCNSSKGKKSIWEWNPWWAYSLSRIRL